MSDYQNLLLNELGKHQSALLRFLTRRLGCENTARDILQVISERLLSEPDVQHIRNPKAYLYTAAANAANSHTRSALARAGYEQAALHARESIDELSPERVVLGVEALAVVEAALSELPLLSKRMFILFRVRGESLRAIAEQFGVSVSTVEKRIAKAANHCHTRLKEAGFTDLDLKPRHTSDSAPGGDL